MFVSKTSLPVGAEILLYGLGYSSKSVRSLLLCDVLAVNLVICKSKFFYLKVRTARKHWCTWY